LNAVMFDIDALMYLPGLSASKFMYCSVYIKSVKGPHR
jgi:hypothetical protein